VGDVIHFRIAKEWVYIPIIVKVSVDDFDPSQGTREEQIEEQLRILREDEAPKANEPALAPQVQQAAAASVTKLSIASMPAGADIEVDGSFVGNTPSTIEVTPGDHTVSVSKSGYKSWERKLKASGGNVNLNAELEAQAK
jgi:CRISPR/Cas system-associated exonuclease Cas4 (RecB family)